MEGIAITEKEREQLDQIGLQVLASEEIKKLALQFYLQYREYLSDNHLAETRVYDSAQLANLFRVAYLLSQKKQETFNLQGERINAIALSVNGILKKSPNYDNFLYHLKQMMRVATINDQGVKEEIQAFIKSFSFTRTFNIKFLQTFQKIRPISEDASLEQSLLWLVFILSKKIILDNRNDIIQTTCLIASLFIYYIKEKIAQTDGQIEFSLFDSTYGGKLSKQSVEHVFLEYFKLKDMASYSQIMTKFNHFIRDISPKKNIFSPETLDFTYKNLDKIYQKKLTAESIDERHFLKDRINTVLTAQKFTPFGGRRPVAKVKNTEKINKIMSQRVLSYENCDDKGEQEQTSESEKSGNQMDLKKIIKLNKTPYSVLINKTPISMAMEIHNWALQKSNYYKFDPHEFPKFLLSEGEIGEKSQKMIYGLWKDICSHIGEKEELTSTDREIYLVLAMEIIFYIMDSNSYPIEKTMKALGLNWFSLWSKIDSVLRYDVRMPTNIKVHLLGLETTIISNHLWKKESILFSILKPEIGTKLRHTNPDYERLSKRIIHELVYQIYFLCKKLETPEMITNLIFQIAQYTMNEAPELCINRNLNHSVLCSTYAVCKVYDLGITFYSILSNFKDLNNLSKDAYNDIVQKIQIEDDTVDIICFYNEIYLKKVKNFLYHVKTQSLDKGKEYKFDKSQKKYVNESVKELLPHNMVIMAEKISKTPGSQASQTPLTQALMAYNQSPLLRERRLKNIGSYVDGKRLTEKKEWSSKEDSLNTASSMISQKFGSKVKRKN